MIIEAARSDAIGDAWTTAGIVAHSVVEISERQARTYLNRLPKRCYLTVKVESCSYWRDDGLHRVNDYGEVDPDTVDSVAYIENKD